MKIEAVLSGTLNYIFNNFQEENTFHDIVSKAVNLGYTEPDPKIDLCGIDVCRKILILARESGKKIEFSDVQNKSFLPNESVKTKSNEEFLNSLKNNNDHFDKILNKALKNKSRLKYVASLIDGQASVGLMEVSAEHPFYNLEGSDNITVFYTDRYKDSPLVVKGAGAGAEVTAGGIFGIYASINLCWTLIIGTAGIFSLATYAIVGISAFFTCWLSINLGLPWWTLPLIGMFIGLGFGIIIALPALRLDGFYYGLLTLGLNELCRVFITTSKAFGSASGGLFGADTFINQDWTPMTQTYASYYSAFLLLIAALFLFRFVDGKRIGRILKLAPEKKESFAEASGVDYKRARVTVFLISSVALGFIGGFYAAYYRGVAFNLFDFHTVVMGLAMITIGGIGRSEGAVVGTLIIVILDRVLIELGPMRYIIIGVLMMFTILFLRNGLFGIRKQFKEWRNKKKNEVRSTRVERGGEMLPEQSTEMDNKDEVYRKRYDKMQREF